MSTKKIQLPMTAEVVRSLKAGDSVLLSGPILTGRDAAHKRLVALLDEGKELPVEVQNQTIYYVGPAPASPGHAVGSAGPTTSYRMDAYAPRLMEIGLNGMIGKGKRNDDVINAMKKYGAVYFGAVGGAAFAHSVDKGFLGKGFGIMLVLCGAITLFSGKPTKKADQNKAK